MTNEITTVASEEILEETVESSEEISSETVEVIGVETFPPDNNQVDNMVYTLPMMGKGMLGIFLVTVIIVASVAILNKVTGGKKND